LSIGPFESNNSCEHRSDPPDYYGTVAKANDTVSEPNQSDVLFPVSGMSQWPGNEFFFSKVYDFQEEFLACETRSKQIQVARQLVHNVRLGLNQQNSTPARFLLRRRSPNEVPGTHFQWSVMDESAILFRLGKAFRGEIGNKKKPLIKRMRNKSIKAKPDKRVVYITQSPTPNDSDEEQNLEKSETVPDETNGGHDPLARIKALCAVYSNINDTLTNTVHETDSSVDESIHQSQPTRSLSNVPQQRKNLGSTSMSIDINRSSGNVIDASSSKDVDVTLPKGVTVRPSGKWVRLICCLKLIYVYFSEVF
jgi:hypothetical protein